MRMRAFGLSPEKLAYEMIDALGLSYDGIDRRTLERFLKKEKRTADATVALYHQYVESLPEPDPVYDLGDAIAEFFELPADFAERRAHIAHMQEHYPGRYKVWDITAGTAPDEPAAELRLTAVPHSPFLAADDLVDRQGIPIVFEGIAIPRGDDLFILLREFVTGDERIYMLRRVHENVPGWQSLSAYFGNVAEKKTARERERNPQHDLVTTRRILVSNVDPETHIRDDGVEEPEYIEAEVLDGANEAEFGDAGTAAVQDEDGTKRSETG